MLIRTGSRWLRSDLLAHARTLSFTQLQVAANHLVEVVDPDTVDQTLEQQLAAQERKALASAWFTGQYGADGIARGRFALPNLTFGMLKKHLDALAVAPTHRHRHRHRHATAVVDQTAERPTR